MQREAGYHTLQPTAVVHEAFMRLGGPDDPRWNDRQHFISTAVTTIRRVLVDHARARLSQKRGGELERLRLTTWDVVDPEPSAPPDVLEVHSALLRLEAIDPDCARVVELRYFGGLTIDETAASLGIGRNTVRELIAIDEGDAEFLEQSPAPGAFELAAQPTPERVGAFTITGVIGEGGFGVVYRGVQHEPVERQVAVKLIRPGMDSPAVLRRFTDERRQLAMLEHPNIARFIDAGITPGDGRAPARPYFVLELVEGPTIARYVESNRLSLDQTLRLFRQVCGAVQHAHARGLIHRDIKPANVLVSESDGDPVCKVIDFGIAKAMQGDGEERATVTIRGIPIGTPQYMSPEQARGEPDIDTRTDVYALGALLYELLAGAPPFEGATSPGSSPSVLLRAIEEAEPDRVSECLAKHPHGRFEAARLRDEIDWIVARAMEKSRERRYQTVVELSQDIDAFQRGMPVSARAPTRAYRAVKFVSRHRSGVAASALAMLGIVGGSVAAVWFGLAAESARQREADQHEVAQRNAARVEAINEFLLQDLFYAVEASDLGPDATLVQLVDRAAPGVPERFADDPTMLVRVYTLLGLMRHKLTRPVEAIGDFTAAAEHIERADDLTPAQRAEVFTSRAHAYRTNGELDLALEDIEHAIQILSPGEAPDLSAHPTLASLKAMVLHSARRFEEAEVYYRIALDAYGVDPDKNADALTRVMSQRLAMLSTMGHDEVLLAQAGELIALSEYLEGNARLASLHVGMVWRSQALLRLGKTEEAAESLLAQVEPVSELFGEGSYMHGSTLLFAGSTLSRTGRGDEGVQLMLEALPMLETHFGPHHYELERATGILANRLRDLGREDEHRDWRIRHKLLRLYVAGPGETESVRAVSREGAELVGREAWTRAMLDETGKLPPGHAKRARFFAHVVVATRALTPGSEPEHPDVLRLCVDAVEALPVAERPGEVAELLRAEIVPLIDRGGTPAQLEQARSIIAPYLREATQSAP
eukprot:g5840.t1